MGHASYEVEDQGELKLRRTTFESRLTTGTKGGSRHTGSQIQVKNKKVRPAGFRPGEFVYRRNEGKVGGGSRKAGTKWKGPFELSEEF
ncbi:hypothetical protein Tco_0158844 [Tanacetum coccineum]